MSTGAAISKVVQRCLTMVSAFPVFNKVRAYKTRGVVMLLIKIWLLIPSFMLHNRDEFFIIIVSISSSYLYLILVKLLLLICVVPQFE